MTTVLTNRIKEFRTNHNITQEELAVQVKVTRKTINTIENGRFVPSVILAIKVAKYFGVPVEEVFLVSEEFV
ncbi:MAG TPA: helix-turn-helix transcriptional regulator [Bacteroidales bacterium]|nr:helix-turn-helix transcriptional regulator [Bacteroidales bacterium]